MFVFLRLALAHFLADFPFQTSEIYNLKKRRLRGRIFHGTIVAIISFVLLLPFYKNIWVWGICLFIGITHSLIDWAKLVGTDKKQNANQFLGFIIDQTAHLSINSIIFLTPLRNIVSANMQNLTLNTIYNNNIYIIYAISYIAVIFGFIYFIDTFRMTYLKNIYKPLDTKEKAIGVAARGIILTLVAVPGDFYPAIVPVILAEIYLLKSTGLKSSFANFIIGTIPVIIIGLLLRFFT